jgi:hypothetical protein
LDEFRASLRAMVSRVKKTKAPFSVDQSDGDGSAQRHARARAAAESFSVDQTGDEARAEAVVNVDDGDVRGAGVEHSE